MQTNFLKQHPATGRIYLRDVITVAFFFPPPIDQVADGLRQVLELYLQKIPPDTLTWSIVGASGEEWKPVNKTTVQRCMALLSVEAAKKRKLTGFRLGDGCHGGDAPGYSIEVLGEPLEPDRPDMLAFVQMSFPMEALEPHTAESFVQFCQQVAHLIPYVSGYASPSLQWSDLHSGFAAVESKGIALRHPGYDVQVNVVTRLRLGRRIRSARWLTFLGPELLARAGGVAHLRQQLSSAIQVESVGLGAMVRAGMMPELGDVNQQVDVPLLREVAVALEPMTAFGDVMLVSSFARHDREFLERWERRLLP